MEHWKRVTKNNPCPICGKPDWCLVSTDKTLTICPRVVSDKQIGDAGYLHGKAGSDDRQKFLVSFIKTDEPIDMSSIAYECVLRFIKENISPPFAMTKESRSAMLVGWDGNGWTFPMSDSGLRVIGIRIRRVDGGKHCVPGSTNALFIPRLTKRMRDEPYLLMPEGESDTIAALDIGCYAIGRPNCCSRIDMTRKVAAASHKDIVIVADNDKPDKDGKRAGLDGAIKIATSLVTSCKSVRIISPPKNIKDLRDWITLGLDKDELYYIIKNTKPRAIGLGLKL